jgi:hypothetical protein
MKNAIRFISFFIILPAAIAVFLLLACLEWSLAWGKSRRGVI